MGRFKFALHKGNPDGEYISLPGKRLLAEGVHYEVVNDHGYDGEYMVVLQRGYRDSLGTVYRFLGLTEDKKFALIDSVGENENPDGNLEKILREMGYNPVAFHFSGDGEKTRMTANNNGQGARKRLTKEGVFSRIENHQHRYPDRRGISRNLLTSSIRAGELDVFIPELEREERVVTIKTEKGKTYYRVHPSYVG